MVQTTVKWWQKAVIYQIYPKSFKDTNADGIGDLRGIIEKLDYLQELGVDAVWLCPINSSPMCDNGYDISDYYTIEPSFGTNEDMYELIEKAKKRNIKIIMDLVVNHCSDQHEWFQKALKDPEGKYGQYFYFRKGIDGKLPNNWRSIFGGSVWEKVEGTDYYYLHIFTKQQPDLNWENPALREEVYKIMNFWLEKGIGGFRLDAITYLKKEPGLPSFEADAKDGMVSAMYGSLNRPGIHAFLQEMKDKTYGRYDAFTVGEVAGAEGEEALPFISLENGFFSSIFDISHIQLDTVGPNYFWCSHRTWDAHELREALYEAQLAIQPQGWYANSIETHDAPRSIDYYLPEEGRNYYGASMLAMLYFYLRGTPFIYQGQEIGMRNFPFASIEEYDDCSSKNQYAFSLEQGYSEEEALHFVHLRSRDNTRYPISWDDSEKAGFTDGKPWLPIHPNHTLLNVAAQESDPQSLLSFYKKLIAIKKEVRYETVWAEGEFVPVLKEYPMLVAYERRTKEKRITILCNYQNESCTISIKDKEPVLLLNNYNTLQKDGNKWQLQPYQALLLDGEV